MYVWINIEKPEDYDEIQDVQPDGDDTFSKIYALGEVASELKQNVRPRVRGILVELAYIDKDYRSTFYHFYAKKGRQYRGSCLRLHLFGETVRFNAETLSLTTAASGGSPSNDYFGFITLRPTYKFTIGRSVIRPDAIEATSGLAVTSRYTVHVLGHELVAEGFPWMQQHSDIAVCAHIACWSILRYYSNEFRKYRELLTHDITRLAQAFDPGGLIPSLGLYVEHAERIFCEAGTYPLVVSSPCSDPMAYEQKAFFRQLFAYLDSGYPLYVVLKDEHAAAAIGYRLKLTAPSGVGISYAGDMVESLILSDDNHIPYIHLTDATFGSQRYCLKDICTFIVPLPDKVYLPAEAVDNLVANLVNDLSLIKFPDQDDLVLRYFLTPIAALHGEMRISSSQFDPELVKEILQLPTAQFVWVMEFSTKDEWLNEQVSVRAIIDATAGIYEEDALWAIYDRATALLFDRRRACEERQLALNTPANVSYGRMNSNLHSIRV